MKTYIYSLIALLVFALSSCGSFGAGMLTALSNYGGYGGGYSSYSSSSGNMNHLLDPQYAIAQTMAQQQQFNQVASSIAQQTVHQTLSEEEQQYQEFCKYNKKPNGSNYSKSEWRTMVGQAIQNSQTNGVSYEEDDTASSPSSSDSGISARRCRKLHASDIIHCEGSGKCAICNGKGRYFDTSFGRGSWIDPCTVCNGTGICKSCKGTGFR